MVSYKVVYTKGAVKSIPLLKSSGLDIKVKKLIEIIKEKPFQNPPPYEKLKGDMEGLYSRRINVHHRLVYKVYEKEKIIQIISMWSHYEY